MQRQQTIKYEILGQQFELLLNQKEEKTNKVKDYIIVDNKYYELYEPKIRVYITKKGKGKELYKSHRAESVEELLYTIVKDGAPLFIAKANEAPRAVFEMSNKLQNFANYKDFKSLCLGKEEEFFTNFEGFIVNANSLSEAKVYLVSNKLNKNIEKTINAIIQLVVGKSYSVKTIISKRKSDED